MSQLQPSVCRGVLSMVTVGAEGFRWGVSFVPLSECVMYAVYRLGVWVVEGVEAEIGGVDGYEGGEVGIVADVEDGCGVMEWVR